MARAALRSIFKNDLDRIELDFSAGIPLFFPYVLAASKGYVVFVVMGTKTINEVRSISPAVHIVSVGFKQN